MLEAIDIHKSFGGLKALNGVSLQARRNQITGLIGPNGSGKSTLFNVVSGFYRKDRGEVYLDGERIDELAPPEIAMRGLVRTFQIAQAPEKMTVLENMLLAPKDQAGERILGVLSRRGRIRQQEWSNLEKAMQMLEIVQLTRLKNEYAGNLSGGQKKLLSLARVLLADPAIILLDEPTAGVNPTLTNHLIEVITRLRDEGKTFFLVEHNMKVISQICDHVFVLDIGEVIARGTPEEIQRNDRVLEAYLSGSTREYRETKDNAAPD